jgi:hypothetical protein
LDLPNREELVDIILRDFLNTAQAEVHQVTDEASVLTCGIIQDLELFMQID